MATCNAVKTGNASDATVWDTVPQAGDTVRCGNYVVTIDLDWDLGNGTLQRNGSGYFKVTDAHTLTLNVASVAGASQDYSGALRLLHSTETVTINGNITGGTLSFASGLSVDAGGSVVINGTATGGTASNAYGVYVAANATVNVTTATGGTGTAAYGVCVNANATVNVTTATGGGNATAYGVYVNAASTVHITTAIGSAVASGVYANANGCVIDDAYPNGFGNGSATTFAAGVATAHNASVKVGHAHCNQYGAWPIAGRAYVDDAIYPNYTVQTYQSDGSDHTLIEPNGSADYPDESDVRFGVSYDNGDFTGSCHVPTPAQVASGVPVDNTVGTAVLLPAAVGDAVWDEARADHTATGTYGKVSEWAGGSPPTVEQIADGVWDEARADHTTDGTYGKVSEWAGGSPPTVEQIADGVWDEARADHTTDGTYGKVSEWAGGSAPTVDEISDGVWDEPRADHTTTGTFGDVATWAAGYGPLRLTVHVTDGGADLSGAGVIVAVGSGLTARYLQTTDPDGHASFFVPYGLSSVTVWKSGYLSYSTSVIMDADRLMEVQLQQLVIPSSGDPGQTSAWLYAYDGAGNVAAGAVITFILAAPPDGTASSYATDEFTATSDENGLVTVNLQCGATYIARRGNGRWVSFTAGTDPTYQLPQVLGRDSG